MNKLTVLLAVATVGLGSLSVHLLTELKQARDETAALQAQVAELGHARPVAATLPDLRPQPPPAATFDVIPRGAPPPKAPPRATASATPSAPDQTPVPDMVRRQMMDRSKLMEDPEYRAAMVMQQRVMLAQQYPDLAAALNLQPDQVDQLFGVLAEQQMRAMQERPPFRGDMTPDPNEIRDWQQRMEQRQRQNQDEIRQVLGDAGVQQWKEYQSTLGARNSVRQLRTVLESSGIPLRQDQVEPLVSAIAAEQKANVQNRTAGAAAYGPAAAGVAAAAASTWATPGMVSGTRGQMPSTEDRIAMSERNIERTEQYNQRLRSAASSYLTSDQLRRYDQMLQQQLDMQRASVRMMRAQAEAEARGDVQPGNPTMIAPGVRLESAPGYSGR
jgi:hypothetical protein